jgi:hypothetical protein
MANRVRARKNAFLALRFVMTQSHGWSRLRPKVCKRH